MVIDKSGNIFEERRKEERRDSKTVNSDRRIQNINAKKTKKSK